MKKINIVTICYTLSILLLLVFIIETIVDYIRYNSTLTSFPFYTWVIVNAVYFIVPSLIALFVGLILNKKKSQANK